MNRVRQQHAPPVESAGGILVSPADHVTGIGTVLTSRVAPAALLATWRPGDVVCWKLPSGLDHTGIVSDRKNARGVPLVIHNLGRCREEDVLTVWQIVGHYRFPKEET